MKIVYVFSILFLYSNCYFSQGWIKVYNFQNKLASAIQTNDGNYRMWGNDGIQITDREGDIVWKTANSYSSATNVSCLTADGGHVLIDEGFLGKFDLYKVDAFGKLLWKNTHTILDTNGANFSKTETILLNEITQLQDGGYVAAGRIDYKNTTTGHDCFVVRFDSNGAVQWNKIYNHYVGFSTSYGIDDAMSISETSDGGFVYTVAAIKSLIKIDGVGNVKWKQPVFLLPGSSNFTVRRIKNEGYIVSGTVLNAGKSLAGITKIDLVGTTQWTTIDSSMGRPMLVIPTNDNGYILEGAIGESLEQILLTKFDSTGKILWKRHYLEYDFWYNSTISHTSDGGYVLAGYFDDKISGKEELVLIKTDSLGIAFPNVISGNVFNDVSGDCKKQKNEKNLKGTIIQANGGPFSPLYTYTDSSGNYNLPVHVGNYIISQTVPLYKTPVCPSGPNVYAASFSTVYDSLKNADFANQSVPGLSDVRITLANVGPVRPGFRQNYVITYKNVGTVPITLGSVDFRFSDPEFLWINSFPKETSLSSTLASWNYSNLQPDESRNNVITLQLDSSVSPLDVPFSFTASVNPVSGDLRPKDNVYVLDVKTQGSYDPNDKQAMPEGNEQTPGRIQSEERIEYVIRFQNTGTDTAFTVIVRDTLDKNLDISSIETVSASHSYEVKILDQGVMKWIFNTILLPDSGTNELESHGFVKYTITTKKGLAYGTEINNRAGIYFDFNPPIITNSTNHIITEPLGESIRFNDETSGEISVFPHPLKDKTHITFSNRENAPYTLLVTDINGREVFKMEKIKGNNATLNRGNLLQGIYFIQLRNESNNSRKTRKLVVD